MKKLLLLVIPLVLIVLAVIAFYSFKFTGEFCGGFVGKICPPGYECQYEGRFPDAGGRCVFSPKFLIIELLNKYR